ncbi:MAG TPA: hypothetical protein VIB02_02410 [Candidatus Limnocylindrales bacterium]
MGADLARLLVLGLGLIITIFGLYQVGAQQSSGLYPLFIGLALIVAAVIERSRYRSQEAEASAARHGPGGGEPAGTVLDARFQPTEERFVDPTTGVKMRVWLDPAAGERRYVAED